jgi:hypothetical protein
MILAQARPQEVSMKTFFLGLAMLAVMPFEAFGFGEIFKVETSGVEYCGDHSESRFNARNNVDLYVQLVSETELLVSVGTPDFPPAWTFRMFGQTYLSGKNTAVFTGNVDFGDGAYATIHGTAKFDRESGAIKSLTGTFIQKDLLVDGCFSSGKFTSHPIR